MKRKLLSLQVYPIDHSQLNWLETLVLKISFSLGICPVCGGLTGFFKFRENLRESGVCLLCRSSNRQRQISFVLLEAIAEVTGTRFSSIKDFSARASQFKSFSNFRIYNAETTGRVHHYMKDFTNYVASEYLGDNSISGECINGVLHQNLMQTSFENDYFDIIITSDVFEHIADPYKAFAEVYRILKPGGRHIFTVPFYSDRYKDELRAVIDEYGTLKNLLPPIYHDDPIRSEGILVYVIFSMEMLLKLNDMGYHVKMYNARNPLKGILGTNAIVFDSIKPL